MRVLHGELVAMQEWVKEPGARICIVFGGRATAGKGGTIKRITERVSPRVFRIVALPAPADREKSQLFVRPELVQPGRRRARHGASASPRRPSSSMSWCRGSRRPSPTPGSCC